MIVFVWTEIKICVYYRLRLQSSSCGRSLKLPIAKDVPIVEKGGAIDDYHVNQTPQGVQHRVFFQTEDALCVWDKPFSSVRGKCHFKINIFNCDYFTITPC